MNTPHKLAEHLYAAALRLLPPAIRRMDGDAMADAFAALWREERSPSNRLALVVRAFSQLLKVAVAEWHDVASRILHGIPRRMSVDPTLQDTKHALRAVRSDPGLCAFAVILIGLGVGATTSVFSVLDTLILRPLPFTQPERLVWIANDHPELGLTGVTSRTSNLRDFREQSQSFSGLTGYFAFFEAGGFNLTGDGEPERLVGVGVARDFLDVLGVQPAVGRGFVAEEGVDGGRRAVILSHSFWKRRYGSDPRIVGSAITIDGLPSEVVGVLPSSFDFAQIFAPQTHVDFLQPYPISDATDQGGNSIAIIGRLEPRVTTEQAQAELDRILDHLRQADPSRWGLGAVVTPLRAHVAGSFRSASVLLAAAAAGVLLIVCVNLSNLLLARGPRRAREMAVRSALGARRGRLVRQLVVESVVLSLLGALVGLGVAWITTRLLANAGLAVPLLSSAKLDTTALLFAVAVAALAGLATGVAPALMVARQGAALSVRRGREPTLDKSGTRLREVLVVAEVALASVLLVAGGLLLRSFLHVLDVKLGFETAGGVVWQIDASNTREFQNIQEQAAYFERFAARISALPGVEEVGMVDALPLGWNRTWGGFRGKGVTYAKDQNLAVYPHLVDHRYLQTMRIPILSGRGFSPDDIASSEQVVVLNESAAEQFFREPDPVGRTLVARSEWRVIGVVGDIRNRSAEVEPGPEIYFPITQKDEYGGVDLVVRSPLPEDVLAPAVSAAIHQVDAFIPTGEHRTLNAIVEHSSSARRFTVSLLAAFAATALLLAAIGLYSVLSYSVAERAPEIGIRMALGEGAAQVRRRVVGRCLALALFGAGLGAMGGFLGSGAIRSLLFGVEPSDPVTYLMTATVLLAVAALAGAVPAVRASRTDPVKVLASG